MTYDPVDTNDDGVVDADVNNQSVSTGSATIGDASTVTGGPVGDSGEFIPLWTSTLLNGDTTTTSTLYTRITGDTDRARLDLSLIDLTNVENLFLSWTAGLNNSGTDTTYARLSLFETGLPSTELSGASFANVGSDRAEITDNDSVVLIDVQAKVDGGTGTVFGNPVVTLWGEIA